MPGDKQPDDLTTVHRPRFDPSPDEAPTFALVAVEGPCAGTTFPLPAGAPSRLLIGKSATCDIRLLDEEVSRRHAAIEFAGRRLRLTDLESTNGTFVDGVAIVEAYIRGGEIVRLGASAFRVEDGPVRVRSQLSVAARFGRLVGASTEMRRLYPLCERLAASDVTVIIEGETGTGKEVLAQSIHDQSTRAAGPFVVFDCTAVPPNLVESELFGHERGAFTGAVARRPGVFEQADGGTLLIDEIGDLDLSLQPKLLRVLESGEVRRIGALAPTRVNVRILAATRRDLDQEIQEGRFRDDLFHRLAVARLELPPLRRRRGDVTVLTRHFCRTMAVEESALDDVLRQWDGFAWPGNVRELRNAVARRLALGDLAKLARSHRADESTPELDPEREGVMERILAMDLPFSETRRLVLDEFEERYVDAILKRHRGNVTHAARAAGVGRRYFQHVRSKRG